MRKVTTVWILMLTLVALLCAMPALASLSKGGHDETDEDHATSWVASGAPGPGSAGAGVSPHLQICEVVVTPTAGEFIEICNGTGFPIDLDNYYLSDDWFTGATPFSCYCRLPAAGYAAGVNSTDFLVRFPAGSVIPPGGVLTIAVDGAGFFVTYGIAADFEINSTDGATPDMIRLSPGAAPTLTNTSEMIMLFYWDGSSDNVCDVDYVQWGMLATGNTVVKTGISVDGPDADAATTAYNADTPAASQTYAAAPGAGLSIIRETCTEGVEVAVGGNGCIPLPTDTSKKTWGQMKLIYR
jgi:hypothetical protein